MPLLGGTAARLNFCCRAMVMMSRLPAMVRSMGLLMESALEDGEDPMVISSEYINVLCQVTSTTGALSFETGEWCSPLSNSHRDSSQLPRLTRGIVQYSRYEREIPSARTNMVSRTRSSN